jgi:dephospho-CoA kinase
LVICVTGMPGSGKSIVAEQAAKIGYRVIGMGEIIREEARSRGVKESPKSLGALMLSLRREEGKDVVAKRCLSKAQSGGPSLIEGVRSLEELYFFHKNAPVFLVAVHASPRSRYKRLLKRGRADDPKDYETFRKRDSRELRVGIGSVIALADSVLINEGSMGDLRRSSMKLLRVMKNADESAR